jgi:hypothetical protein
MQLSKSDYLLFLRHPAWLWLKKHRRQVLPEPDAVLKARFEAGHRFEAYAEQIFPAGIKLGFDSFSDYASLTTRTYAALADGAKVLLQGRFEHDQLTCIIDVLQRVDGDVFDLFEIKASTKVKPEHVPDLAFQVHVLEGAGLKIRKTAVVHANNQYVRAGDIDPQSLTGVTDVTDKVNALRDRDV